MRFFRNRKVDGYEERKRLFAWTPVEVDEGWVWLEWVWMTRRYVRGRTPDRDWWSNPHYQLSAFSYSKRGLE